MLERRTYAALLCVGLGAFAGLIGTGGGAVAGTTTVPRPDHVVIVVEENHSSTDIIGNASAPYINSLATQNASFTQSFAVTHPSEPNYLALFSGSTQGVTDDSCPHAFTTPSLGDELLAAGRTFTGYSESLPSAGYTGCVSGKYAAKHNPWVDFPSLPASTNQPMSAFPTDYSTLPDVSYVIPNLDDDMHDGTVAQGDTWLQNNLGGYITWAKTHNSLFVLTFDEDDNSSGNQIPTIMAGQRVTPGSYAESINHYSVLRTVQDAFGLAPLGNTATASPVLDVWNTGSGNQPPTAAFTPTCTNLTCSLDATASTDPDGTVTTYTWDYGDTTTGTGKTPTHTYAQPGTYTVTLTVTDNNLATATTTQTLTLTAPPPPNQPFALDTFTRTLSTGWGTADIGGTWTSTSPSAFSVTPGAGTIRHTSRGSQFTNTLTAVSSSDTDLTFGFNVDKLTAGYYLTATARRVSAGNEYQARILITSANKVDVWLTKDLAGTQTTLVPERSLPTITYTPGLTLRVRFDVTGTNPTTSRVKVWPTTTTEPTTWFATTTDTTPTLQAPGALALTSYLSSATTNPPLLATFTDLTARHTVTAPPPPNQPPTAAFTPTCTNLTCSLDATASTDPDGTVTTYTWDYGDTTTGTGKTPTHTYAQPGTYTVTLTVTDNNLATATTTHTLTLTAPPPPNQPPTAAFTPTCTNLTCSLDATASTDPDGTVTTYTWDYGDTTTGTGKTPTHTYAQPGTYTVTLTVTDNNLATATTTQTLTLTAPPPPNQPPTAAFTPTCTNLTCTLDATASTDPDGTVTTYTWDYGDTTTGTGKTPTHTYAQPGTYTVTLTVTDNNLATATTTHTLTLTAPPPPNQPFALDTFTRTLSTGWGTADIGGTWTSTSPSAFSVTPGAGTIRHTSRGSQFTNTLTAVSSSDTDLTFGFNVDKLTAGYYLTATARRVSAGNEYQARILITSANKVDVWLTKDLAGTQTTLVPERSLPTITYTPGLTLRVRFDVTGTNPTTSRVKVWPTTTTEPTTWFATTTDTTPTLQAPGALALTSYLSSATTNPPLLATFTDLTARHTP